MVQAQTQIAKYEAGYQNAAAITAGSSFTFFSNNVDKAATSQWGSFNNLEIVNNSNEDVAVDLDTQTTRRRLLFARSTMVIKAEQGVFWNNVKVTNQHSTTQIEIGELLLIGRIVRL